MGIKFTARPHSWDVNRWAICTVLDRTPLISGMSEDVALRMVGLLNYAENDGAERTRNQLLEVIADLRKEAQQ